MAISFHVRGKMSTFGGPDDSGVGPHEGLALVDAGNILEVKEYFLPEQPEGTTGLARRLNPETFYIACRWDYHQTSKDFLRRSMVAATNPRNGKTAMAKPVDWGPNIATGRVTDLSPGLATYLALNTDDLIEVTLGNGPSKSPSEPPLTPGKVFHTSELEHYFGAFTSKPDPRKPGGIIIDPPWPANNITAIIIPVLKGKDYYGKPFHGKVERHKKIAADLEKAFNEVQSQGLGDLILSFDGSFVPRHQNWDIKKPLSSHSWGVALDLNRIWNERGHPPAPEGKKGSVIKLVPIFEKYGFTWGGYFSTPDGMHFEYARPPKASQE
jgi:hypothetical protein